MMGIQIFNQIKTEIKVILEKALNNIEISSEEALKLLKVHGKEFFALQYTANELCFKKKKDIVTYVINRNINFTNVCFQGCKFCSFSLPANHEDAFLLNLDEIKDRVISGKDQNWPMVVQGHAPWF